MCLPVSAVPRRELYGSIRREAMSEPAAPSGQRRLEGMRILIVDDEDDTRDMLTALLDTNGASVTSASYRPSLSPPTREPKITRRP